MALSSGPMVGVDIGAFADGEKVTKIKPWKMWQFDMQRYQSNKTPIWFFQPNPLIDQLMAVYDKFSAEADNKSGIPKYSYGADADSGAAKTASGFSMMMGNATKGVKKVIKNIDRGIVASSIKRLHEWLLRYDQEYKGKYKGDIKIISRGSSALLVKEQQTVRRNEFLNILLNSETAKQIAGMDGVAEVLREIVKSLDLGLDNVIPTKEQLRQRQMRANIQQAMMQRQPQRQIPPGQQQRPRALNHDGSVAGGQDARLVA